LARRDELALLPRIEAQAGERLRGHPAAALFAASPTEPALFEQAWQRGMLWVVASEDVLAGYLMAGALARTSISSRWTLRRRMGAKVMVAPCCDMPWRRRGRGDTGARY